MLPLWDQCHCAALCCGTTPLASLFHAILGALKAATRDWLLLAEPCPIPDASSSGSYVAESGRILLQFFLVATSHEAVAIFGRLIDVLCSQLNDWHEHRRANAKELAQFTCQ